jgi:hypothetical protein
MTDQEAIDSLNTFIAHYESAVSLKASLEQAKTASERIGTATAKLQSLEAQANDHQHALDALDATYQAKHDELEANLEIHRRSCAASKDALSQAHDEYQAQVDADKAAMTASLMAYKDKLQAASDAATKAEQARIDAENNLAAAKQKYEEYKASL